MEKIDYNNKNMRSYKKCKDANQKEDISVEKCKDVNQKEDTSVEYEEVGKKRKMVKNMIYQVITRLKLLLLFQ